MQINRAEAIVKWSEVKWRSAYRLHKIMRLKSNGRVINFPLNKQSY